MRHRDLSVLSSTRCGSRPARDEVLDTIHALVFHSRNELSVRLEGGRHIAVPHANRDRLHICAGSYSRRDVGLADAVGRYGFDACLVSQAIRKAEGAWSSRCTTTLIAWQIDRVPERPCFSDVSGRSLNQPRNRGPAMRHMPVSWNVFLPFRRTAAPCCSSNPISWQCV
jgi:hypothetical protein